MPGGAPLRVATVHLESPSKVWPDRGTMERWEQLRQSFRWLEGCEDTILIGDFNWLMHGVSPESCAPQPIEGYADIWTQLNDGDSGFTYERRGNAARLDRCLFRTPSLIPKSAQLFGRAPIAHYFRNKNKVQVPPSDHLALHATFTFGSDDTVREAEALAAEASL
eukprot:gene56890-biopygen114390